MKPILRELLAGGVASGFLVAGTGIMSLALLPAVGLAGVVYLGVRMVLPGPAPVEVASGVTKEELDATVRQIRTQAARFDHFGDRLRNPMRKRLRHIAQVSRDMIGHLKRDPANLALAAEFLELHLPKALKIVENYTLLSQQPYLDASSQARLEEAQQTISMIEKAFEAQHQRMLESDVMAFDIDRRVYEELLRLDGHESEFEGIAEQERDSASPPARER